MKTSHQLAAELLAGPDLPVFHFDPSLAGYDEEHDTSLSEPQIEIVKADGENVGQDFITICGRLATKEEIEAEFGAGVL